MEATPLMELILDAEAVFRKIPHLVAGITAALFWLWLAERPKIIKFINPHRKELEGIFDRLTKDPVSVTPAEAEIAKGAMHYGAIVKSAIALLVGWLVTGM